MAKRVLPTPPGPVSDNKREDDNSLAISFNSFSRPIKLVSGTGIFEEISLAINFVEMGIGFRDSFPDLRFSYNSFVCSEGSMPNSRREFTQRLYVAATLDISPFA